MSKQSRDRVRKKFEEACDANVDMEIIPSWDDLKDENEVVREKVGAYCRVSTKDENQTFSFEMQKKYYSKTINDNPNWDFAGIYADEGISGTAMKNRKELQRLLRDCKAGRVTLILTKEVSRFARNQVECISTIRMLKSLPKPVGVIFETQGVDTRSPDAEDSLGFLATIAEAESRIKSKRQQWSVDNRAANGIPMVLDVYGYDRVNTRELIINEAEAEVVKYIYRKFIAGYDLSLISDSLEAMKIPTPKGYKKWSIPTLRYILTNEKYCGQVLIQKTLTVDLFSHKTVKNIGQKRRYLLRDHHVPIIPYEQWEVAQQILDGKILMDINIYEDDIPITFSSGQRLEVTTF